MKLRVITYCKRFLWLLAWGVWLWLGFGLYRELPRRLGENVCKLPLLPHEEVDAFLHDATSIITRQQSSSTVKPVFRRRSAMTGEIERIIASDQFPADSTNHVVLPHQNCVIAFSESTWFENSAGNVVVVDLDNGERRIFLKLGALRSVHPEKPWAIFVHRINVDEQHLVVDLKTGNRLFAKNAILLQDGWPPFFIGDLLAVPFRGGAGPYWLAIQSLPSGTFKKVVDNPGNEITLSRNGKVAWYRFAEKFEVFDGFGGRLLASDDANYDSTDGFQYPPVFSKSERTVLSPGTGALIELKSERRLWRLRANEGPIVPMTDDRFEVMESWSIGYGKWKSEFVTYVVRRLDDGSVVFRTWWPPSYKCSHDGGLIVADGVVHRLLPHVDWPLLALCQFILALPLVLPWAALKWKRRRTAKQTMRIQPVVTPESMA